MTTPQGTAGSAAENCAHFRYADGDPRVDRLGLGVAAVDLTRLGYAAGPLECGLKRPHSMLGATGGVHHASNDPRQAEQWWGLEDRFANVFVRTGQLPFPGTQVCVVDLDTKSGQDGPGNFTKFLEQHRLSLPPGPVARTPSGGYHLWLGWPPGWGPCPERPSLLAGVDIKGDSGYVVVPPSFLRVVVGDSTDGERGGVVPLPYAWERGCPCQLPWAPAWFGEWIRTAAATGRPQGSAGPGAAIDADAVMTSGAEPGTRNNTYYKLACSRYRRHGTGMEGAATVLAEVRAAWEAGDRTGMPWTEVLTSIASARRFITGQEQAERMLLAQWRAYNAG